MATLTGETKTEAVRRALQDRLTRRRSERSGRSVTEDLADIARHDIWGGDGA